MTHLIGRALVLAAEAGGPAPAGGGEPAPPSSPMAGLWGLAPFVLILIAFFWFTSRSQKKRERQRREMLDGIKVKDDVMTIGGIHGRVVQVKDDAFVLRIDPEKDIKITISKSGVSRRAGDGEEED
jgi:preprotein translocase subunit YajC